MKKVLILVFLLVCCYGQQILHLQSSGSKGELKNNLRKLTGNGDGLPVVVAHGLGDACVNPGQVDIENTISSILGVSATCVPYGNTETTDVLNAYIQDMTTQVDNFARKLQRNRDFRRGVKVIGFSHGTIVLRGYIQRYAWREDYPSVSSFIAVHGPLAGVGAIPKCDPLTPIIGEVCEVISDLAGPTAYLDFFQDTIAQANYYRHPCFIDQYLETKFLPPLNGETDKFYEDVGEIRGLESLNQLVLIKAERDSIVYPVDSSWFGHYKDYDCKFDFVTTIFDTAYYKNDAFGLKSLNDAGKLTLLSTPGDHLDFSKEYFMNLIDTYWN